MTFFILVWTKENILPPYGTQQTKLQIMFMQKEYLTNLLEIKLCQILFIELKTPNVSCRPFCIVVNSAKYEPDCTNLIFDIWAD